MVRILITVNGDAAVVKIRAESMAMPMIHVRGRMDDALELISSTTILPIHTINIVVIVIAPSPYRDIVCDCVVDRSTLLGGRFQLNLAGN